MELRLLMPFAPAPFLPRSREAVWRLGRPRLSRLRSPHKHDARVEEMHLRRDVYVIAPKEKHGAGVIKVNRKPGRCRDLVH